MNLVLLVTTANLPEIREFTQAASKLQTEPVNGALLIFHQVGIPTSTITALADDLRPMFRATLASPCNVNEALGPNGGAASLFARFLINGYTRYPGPWLVVDGFSVPVVPNFMQVAFKQHRAGNGQATGRGICNPGSICPVGPVVLELPVKRLKVLQFPAGNSWRERGQFVFARCGFSIVPAADYLFSISPEHTALKEVALPPEPVKRLTRNDIPLPVIAVEASTQTVDVEEIKEDAPPKTSRVYSRSGLVDGELPFVAYSSMDKETLLRAMDDLGIGRPHPATGTTRLAQIIHDHFPE